VGLTCGCGRNAHELETEGSDLDWNVEVFFLTQIVVVTHWARARFDNLSIADAPLR
jgi:hypothetical protein